MRKKMPSFILILCMLIGSALYPVYSTEVGAKTKAEKDVTNTIAGKKKIRALVSCLETPCGYALLYKMKAGKTKTYDFSKASARRYVTNMCSAYYPRISANTVSKRLFGKSTSKLKEFLGDWGTAWPKIKVKKIYRLSSKKYRVDAQILWVEEDVGRSQIGTLKVYLKKEPKSYYGYTMASMTLKNTAR